MPEVERLMDPYSTEFLLQLNKARAEPEGEKHILDRLVHRLEALREKLLEPKHTLFSDVDNTVLRSLDIDISPLFLIHDKIQQVRDLGSTEAGCLSMETIWSLISLVRSHVSTATEAGCCTLINVLLLRVISVLQSNESTVNMVPGFPLPEAVFEQASGKYAFNGAIDFLIAKVPAQHSVHFLEFPMIALGNPKLKGLVSLVFKAKHGKLRATLPQAAVAAASYCQVQRLPAVRGIVSSGEEWLFFIYEKHPNGSAVIQASLEFSLGENTEDLPFILGLLQDWINNATSLNNMFFSLSWKR